MALRVAQLAARTGKGWHVLDGAGKSLGRMAAEAAVLLTGKGKPTYHASQASGDYVVIVNAEKVALSEKKLDTKVYKWHTQYAGGLKETTLRAAFADAPDDVVRKAVWGMLPKNKDRKRFNRSLFIFPGPSPPFEDDVAAHDADLADALAARAHLPEHKTSLLAPSDSNAPVASLLAAVGSRVTALPDNVVVIGPGADLPDPQ